MRRYALAFLPCFYLVPACSMMQPTMQSVSVGSTDGSADIYADGQLLGQGAATVSLARNKTHSFMAKTSDGRVATGSIDNHLSTTGGLDILGGIFFLFPFAGLFTPGAWTLDATSITLVIPPAPVPHP